MTNASLQKKFAWSDVVENGQCKGWGWIQNCMLREGKVEIDCIQVPETMPGHGMKLHITAAQYVTLLDYTDSGFVLHEYVAGLAFEAVLTRLRHVRATQVHLVASELLNGLAKDGLLSQLFGNQCRRGGQFTH
ncbi:hypothetical protein [Rhodoferax antarcticus]|uniref:hypothetical protein n=1 Tax=Rhodoferax antarcticus TaxID=81479 RepID=UPI002225A327|nr:hypothetical protein [Rhodoferax antarcticus]MCW2312061.1 hypothetical protein [Rhodoferax antarcticus]